MTAAVVHEPPAWRRWSARLAWFVAGAIVHALLTTSDADRASSASSVSAHADPAPDAQRDSPPALGSEPAPPDADRIAASSIAADAIAPKIDPAIEPADDPTIDPSHEDDAHTDVPPTTASADASPPTADAPPTTANADATPQDVAATPSTANAPTIPLPRMPGTRRLRSTATPSDDGRGWVLVHALQVPAKPEQVETFYRKALADQGLRITGGSTPAQPGRVFLRGRGRRAHADITIAGRGNRARTSVQVIWRSFR